MLNPSVFIIILNFNGYKDTIECVESLKKITYKNFNIVIVDNASEDNSESILREAFPYVKLLSAGSNLGYAGGNNIGIKYAMEIGAEYVCILNNDVVVKEDFLEPIIKKMEDDKSIGMAGPKICEYFDRTIIQSTGANINLCTGDVSPSNRGVGKNRINKDFEVDYIGGACMVVRRDFIEKLGVIPEEYFLFFEETEWCLNAKKNMFKIVCVVESEVYHKGSSSINRVKGLAEYYITRNRIIFEKRNANIFQFTVFLAYNFIRVIYNIIINYLRKRSNKHLLKGFLDGFKY